MDIPSYSVRVLVNSNRTKEYRHEGRTFIEAKTGSEYELDIRNSSGRIVLAIPSVDGVCTIDGLKATDSSPGFIIQPCSKMRVKGYTYTNYEVGAFKFAEKGYGYASGKGEGQNVGVIGVKFVGEKVQYISSHTSSLEGGWNLATGCSLSSSNASDYHWELPRQDVNQYGKLEAINRVDIEPPRLVRNSAPDFTVETTWGSKKQQKTKEKEFERGEIVGLIEIFYSDRQALLNAGVIVPHSDSVSFPKSFSSYATPPKGWH